MKNNFHVMLHHLRRALRASPGSADAAGRLRAVLDRYRGDFLASESAGDWHLELRDHLRRLWLDGLVALGDHLAGAESHAEAAEAYRTVVRADGLNEEAHRRLMAALVRAGQRGEALCHYDRFVALLRDDLGVTPERQTTVLYEQLRRAETV